MTGDRPDPARTAGESPLDVRRRRALYRAEHRGTKEMDWLLGRFAMAKLPAMPAPELSEFERLLTLPDPGLQSRLLAPTPDGTGEFSDLIDRIRAFHGL